MLSLVGAGQNLPDAKVLCRQIKCLGRANFVEATVPIAPMVPTPMSNAQIVHISNAILVIINAQQTGIFASIFVPLK